MLKKVLRLASLSLLITFLGAACAPAASQKDLQALQYQVQALSLSLATTQNNLLATQEALQNVQNQNQQLQNQLQQTSTECSTCDKAAQACVNNNVVVNPYGCVGTSPYYYNPCTYPTPSTPIACSPYYPYYYFFPHPYGTHCGPWGYYPPVHPSPSPHPSPCPHPYPPPDPHPQSVTFTHPIATELIVNTPAIEPMATDVVTFADPPAVVTQETTPPVIYLAEPVFEPLPAPEPELATYTTPADVPEPVLEITPPTPATTEPPVITDVPAVPAPEISPTFEALNEPAPEIITATEPLPEIAPEPVLPVIVITAPAPQPELATYPTPSAVPDTVLEAAPTAPAAADYPVITEAPPVPIPPVSETAKATDETKADPT